MGEGGGWIRVDGERGRESRSQRGRGKPENEIFFLPREHQLQKLLVVCLYTVILLT